MEVSDDRVRVCWDCAEWRLVLGWGVVACSESGSESRVDDVEEESSSSSSMWTSRANHSGSRWGGRLLVLFDVEGKEGCGEPSDRS